MATESVKKEEDAAAAKPEEPEKIHFRCSGCAMVELVDYFGRCPPFVKNLELLEESYVMRDPFSAPPTKLGKRSFTEYFIVIGSNCHFCESQICKDCLIFYKSSSCFPCAEQRLPDFPLEMQSKIRKEILAIKSS